MIYRCRLLTPCRIHTNPTKHLPSFWINILRFPSIIMLVQKRFSFAYIFFLFLGLSAKAQLSGTYTIDPNGNGSTNFLSFNHVIDSLKTVGVSGAVSFFVQDGTYNEQMVIPAISGANAQNTIRFIGNPSDSNAVILTYPSSPNSNVNNYIIKMDGADYFTFEYLTLDRSGNLKYARILDIHNQAEHNTFSHNLFRGNYNGSGSNTVLIYSGFDNDNYNTFSYNHFRSASAIFLYYGYSNSIKEEGTLIEHNFSDSCQAGMYLKYQKSPSILQNNLMMFANNNYHSGIEIRNCGEVPRIIGNTMYFKSLGYGINVYESDCDINQPGEILNNSIQAVGSSYTDGIYLYSSDNYRLIHNSVESSGSSSLYSSTPLVLSYGSMGIKLWNNIFRNIKNGVAIQADSGSIAESFCNGFATNGDFPIYYGDLYTVNDWTTSFSLDSGSFSDHPLFYDSPLTPREINYNGRAKYVADVSNDILGVARVIGMSDIGAVEFTPAPTDLYLYDLSSKFIEACNDTSRIMLHIKNNGSADIDSLFLSYRLNFSTWIDTTVSLNLNSTKDTLYHFLDLFISNPSNSFQVSVYGKNLGADADSSDNIKFVNFKSRMSGTYAIGGTNFDYANITSCFNDLASRGVCGPVIMNVADGDYYTNVRLKPIEGSSKINTITVQGASQDSSKVRMYYPSVTVGGTNYVVWLEGADHVHFKHLTFERTGTNSYISLIRLTDQANHNSVRHCVLRGNNRGSSISSALISSFDTDANDSNIYSHNMFSAGPYGLNIGASNETRGTLIFENIFDSIRNYGLRLDKHPNINIHHNTFLYSTSIGSSGALLMDSCYDFTIAYNQINLNYSPSVFYFINCYEGNSSNRVFNNTLRFRAQNASSAIFLNKSRSIDIYHNTIRILANPSYTNNTCIETNQNTGNNFRIGNNIFLNESGGTVFNDADNSLQNSFSNVLYTSGNYSAKRMNTDFTFHEWVALGMDTNSSMKHPYLNEMMVPRSGYINNISVKLTGINDDLYGQARALNPDPGAIEFDVDSFVSIGDVILNTRCEDSAATLAILLVNLGQQDQSAIQVSLAISGTENGNFILTYNDTLKPYEAATIYLDDTVFTAGYDSLVIHAIGLNTLMDGLNDTLIRTYSILPLPVIQLMIDSACEGSPVNFSSNVTTTSIDSIISYQWIFGDGDSSTLKDATHTYNQASNFILGLHAASSNGCANYAEQSIWVKALPDPSFTQNITERTAQFSAIAPRISGAIYSWSFGDGAQDTGYAVSHTYVQDGTYSVKLEIEDFPCVIDKTESLLIENLGLNPLENQFPLTVYPNPSGGNITVQFSLQKLGSVNIRIYSMTGALSYETNIEHAIAGSNGYKLNPQLLPGTYLIEVHSNEGVSRKLIQRK